MAASMIEERVSPRKSVETSGSSLTPRMPFIGPSAAVRKAALSSSTRRRARDVGGEVDDADRRGRDAQAEAVELALQVGDDEREGLGRAGRRRDDVLAGGPRPARVLVGDVEDPLVVRVAVDRVHQAALDAEQVVDDLGRGREAVRRAAGVADDVVARRVVLVLVDAEHDRDVLALGRGADDHLLRAGRRCGPWPCSASVKMPVDSRTMSTPRSPHGRAAGSFSLRTLISRPSMIRASSVWSTVPG